MCMEAFVASGLALCPRVVFLLIIVMLIACYTGHSARKVLLNQFQEKIICGTSMW